MNTFSVREEMMIQYLKEAEAVDATHVYVTETTDANVRVDITIDHDFTYTDEFPMSHVIAWVWSKIK